MRSCERSASPEPMSLVRIASEKGRTFGWQARRGIPGTNRYKSAFFSDLKYGSDRKALEAATAALADMERRWPKGTHEATFRTLTSERARRMNRVRWDKQRVSVAR